MKPRGKSLTKEFEGKTYHWCCHHQKWTLHKPQDCHLNPGAKNKQDKPTNTSPAAAVSLEAILHQDPFHSE